MDMYSREFEAAVLTLAAELVQQYVIDNGSGEKFSGDAIDKAIGKVQGTNVYTDEMLNVMRKLLKRYSHYVITVSHEAGYKEYCARRRLNYQYVVDNSILEAGFFNALPDPQAERAKSLNMFNYACGKFA